MRKFWPFPTVSCYYLSHRLPSLLRAFPLQLMALLKLTALHGFYRHWSFSSGRQSVALNSQLWVNSALESESFNRNLREKPLLLNPCLNAVSGPEKPQSFCKQMGSGIFLKEHKTIYRRQKQVSMSSINPLRIFGTESDNYLLLLRVWILLLPSPGVVSWTSALWQRNY